MSPAPLVEAEAFTKPGTANVSPGDLKKLAPLMRHYAAKPHPFTSCKRDQLKHGLSEDHANRRCAVLKDLIRGTTKWRNREEEEAARAAVQDAKDRIREIGAVIGEDKAMEMALAPEPPRLIEEGEREVWEELIDCATILNYVGPTLQEARTWVPSYKRLGQNVSGYWRELSQAIGLLSKDESLTLPGGVRVNKGRYRGKPMLVRSPNGDTSPYMTPTEAAKHALDLSAKTTDPESPGGEKSHGSLTSAVRPSGQSAQADAADAKARQRKATGATPQGGSAKAQDAANKSADARTSFPGENPTERGSFPSSSTETLKKMVNDKHTGSRTKAAAQAELSRRAHASKKVPGTKTDAAKKPKAKKSAGGRRTGRKGGPLYDPETTLAQAFGGGMKDISPDKLRSIATDSKHPSQKAARVELDRRGESIETSIDEEKYLEAARKRVSRTTPEGHAKMRRMSSNVVANYERLSAAKKKQPHMVQQHALAVATLKVLDEDGGKVPGTKAKKGKGAKGGDSFGEHGRMGPLVPETPPRPAASTARSRRAESRSATKVTRDTGLVYSGEDRHKAPGATKTVDKRKDTRPVADQMASLVRQRKANRRALDKLRAKQRGRNAGSTTAAIDRRLKKDRELTMKLAQLEGS